MMRALFLATTVIAAAALVVSCGKATDNQQAAAPAPSSAAPETAPAPLTQAQKAAALATLPAAYQHADLDNGEAKFALCKSCHTVVQGGASMTGPNLYGVFGRKAGASPGFTYSDGLKASGIVWDAPKIDQWITNPRAIVPMTKMTYAGMQDPKDRTDLIAYLKVATTPPGG
jgi:cytochrome c